MDDEQYEGPENDEPEITIITDDSPLDTKKGKGPKKPKERTNITHPRSKIKRQAIGDDNIKRDSQWGAWDVESWNGVDVIYHIHIGGQAGAISNGRMDKARLALCSIVADHPDRLGAAFMLFGRKVTDPAEATWIHTESSVKAAKAVWLKFVRGTMAKGYKWEDIHLVMTLDGRPHEIRIPDPDRPTRFTPPVGRQGQGVLGEHMWNVWAVDHYDDQQQGRHKYLDRMVSPDCPIRFEESTHYGESHPAVRAHAINYFVANKCFSFRNGLMLPVYER